MLLKILLFNSGKVSDRFKSIFTCKIEESFKSIYNITIEIKSLSLDDAYKDKPNIKYPVFKLIDEEQEYIKVGFTDLIDLKYWISNNLKKK